MKNIEEELKQLPNQISKAILKICKDLSNIDGFEVLSVNTWKSNLPTLLPTIGSKMESEIKNYLDGLKVILQDQKLRDKWSTLEIDDKNKN